MWKQHVIWKLFTQYTLAYTRNIHFWTSHDENLVITGTIMPRNIYICIKEVIKMRLLENNSEICFGRRSQCTIKRWRSSWVESVGYYRCNCTSSIAQWCRAISHTALIGDVTQISMTTVARLSPFHRFFRHRTVVNHFVNRSRHLIIFPVCNTEATIRTVVPGFTQ